MRPPGNLIAIFCLAACLTGCAASGNGAILSKKPEELQSLVTIGVSTKTDVKKAFGDASVTRFADGHEIWVYEKKSLDRGKYLRFVPMAGLAMTARDLLGSHEGDTMSLYPADSGELAILFDKDGIARQVAWRQATV